MFDAPIDAWYVWVGLSLVSLAALATVAELPTAPPPDAGAAASTVDRVAAADHDATGRHPVEADAVRLSAHAIALRDDGRVARARLRFGPVVPVGGDGPLAAVARGEPAARHFDSPSELRRAATRARDGSGSVRDETPTRDGSATALDATPARDGGARWQRTDRLFVRTVTWGEVRVTLVGA